MTKSTSDVPTLRSETISRLTMLLSIVCALLAVIGQVHQAPAAEKDAPPNIVIIFIDDMGYADIGPFGAKGYETPNLDRMAEQGRRFTDFYVSQAVCSASRASLMTGCYNVRVGILGALGPKSNIGISDKEVTLAELCRQKGYATACYGKWHLGHREKFLPMQHGFDDYFGLPYSNDMWPYHPGVMHLPMAERLKHWPHLPLIDKNDIVNPQVTGDDQKQLTTQITERGIEFIEQNKDRPFFLYLPHPMVHVPLYVSDKFAGKSEAGLFGDVVMELDWSVGQILDTLKKHQLEEKTLVIFTSDNGPWLSYGDHAGSAAPLREGKGTMFDGGCRVPTLMWWPGTIPAGTDCSEPAMTIDLLPTVAELIDGELPEHKIDGKSILPLMLGTADAKSPHEAYYFYYGNELQGIRMGRWKLLFPHRYRTIGDRKGGTGGKPVNYSQGEIELSLFDLSQDIGEQKNVADEHPEVVEKMKQLADEMRKDLGDSLTEAKGSGKRAPGAAYPNVNK